MADTEDLHHVTLQLEQNSTVAHPQPERTGKRAVQRDHLARARTREVQNAFEDPHGRLSVQRSDIGFAESSHSIWYGGIRSARRQIFHRDAEFGQYVFHREASAAVLFKPSLVFANAAQILFGDGLIVGPSGGDGECNRVEHVSFVAKNVAKHPWRHCTAVEEIEDADAFNPPGAISSTNLGATCARDRRRATCEVLASSENRQARVPGPGWSRNPVPKSPAVVI